MQTQLATKAGLDFAHLVIGAVSKGENFPHGKPGWAWAYAQQQKAAGKPWVALPVMADEGLKESVEGSLLWKGEPYKTRAMIINAANPIRHYYSDSHWKAIMTHDNVELVVGIDVLPSDTTPYMDVILPNSTYLERNEPTLYGNGVNQDLAVTTRYAAIESLYDTWETPDILLKFTEIISGKTDEFLKGIQGLVGLPAEAVKKELAKQQQAGTKSPFSAACRTVSFAETAKRLHTTPENIDKVLREKGIYHEQSWPDILKHAAVPYQMPAVTPSGRIEFFSGLFDSLRGMGVEGPQFSVLAAINVFKGDIYKGVWLHPDRANALGIASGDTINLTNTLSGQQAQGVAYVTRKIRRDSAFLHSSFGVENQQLTRSFAYGGTATNKLIPHTVEPVVAGFRSQEFTLKIAKA